MQSQKAPRNAQNDVAGCNQDTAGEQTCACGKGKLPPNKPRAVDRQEAEQPKRSSFEAQQREDEAARVGAHEERSRRDREEANAVLERGGNVAFEEAAHRPKIRQ